MPENRNSFKSYKSVALTEEEWQEARIKPMLDKTPEAIALADDWLIAYHEKSGYTKYGRHAYSPSLKQFRQQTMGEFYQGGVVD